MRGYERSRSPVNADFEFPSRYILDESRFRGGRTHIRNEEEKHEPTNHFA